MIESRAGAGVGHSLSRRDRATPFLMALLALLAGCARPVPPPTATAPPLWPSCEPISEQERWGIAIEDPQGAGYTLASSTEHFDFWLAPGAAARDGDPEIGEAHLALMEGLLGYDFTGRIQLFVYPDPEAVVAATGMDLLIRRDRLQLRLAGSRHLHEVTHLLTYAMAGHRSVPLFEEGFAEAHGNWAWRPGDPAESLAIKDWTGEHVDVMTARDVDAVPPLRDVLEDRAFRGYQGQWSGSSYVFAASFDLYLVRAFGMPAFADLLRAVCVEDPAEVVLAKFEAIYPLGLDEAEQAWRESLGSG